MQARALAFLIYGVPPCAIRSGRGSPSPEPRWRARRLYLDVRNVLNRRNILVVRRGYEAAGAGRGGRISRRREIYSAAFCVWPSPLGWARHGVPVLSQVFLHQSLVDGHRRLGAFGRGDDDELSVLGAVARDE
jgi:hypothetical protein